VSDPLDQNVLVLERFGVAFGGKTVLADVSLTVPDRGVVTLMGPGGSGKSTLLRTLAGFNDAQPALRTRGRALYCGEPLGHGPPPALVMQNARMLLDSVFGNLVSGLPERHLLERRDQVELAGRLLHAAGLAELVPRMNDDVIGLSPGLQRRLAILRTAVSGPRLLCHDETTAGLDEAEADAVLEMIRAQANVRAVLLVTHNQLHARALGGRTALLAGGRVIEFGPTEEFFASPRSPEARQFVRTGGCSVPGPDARPEDLESEPLPGPTAPADVPVVEAVVVPPVAPASPFAFSPADSYVSESFGPTGFRWLHKGRLGGMPRPGLLRDLDRDLEAVRRVGVRVLISLEEDPPDPEPAARFGLSLLHFPIPDMRPPEIGQAMELCRALDEPLRAGTPAAVHCRAGLGRTGTVLACRLIWEGAGPAEALEAVRRIEPRWVQSDEQVAFLPRFASALRAARVE
jgi:atypical dual specificity phosphatase